MVILFFAHLTICYLLKFISERYSNTTIFFGELDGFDDLTTNTPVSEVSYVYIKNISFVSWILCSYNTIFNKFTHLYLFIQLLHITNQICTDLDGKMKKFDVHKVNYFGGFPNDVLIISGISTKLGEPIQKQCQVC